MNLSQLDNTVAGLPDGSHFESTRMMVHSEANDPTAASVPQEFICPITLQVMVCPVMTRAGINYERAAIISWLQKGSGDCPMTRTPLAPKDIVPHRALENKIALWCRNNNVHLPVPEVEMTDLEAVGFVGFVPVNQDNARHMKLLKRLERKIRKVESGVPERRHHSHRHGLDSSSSGRTGRLVAVENMAAAPLPPAERLATFRQFLPCARRTAA